MGRVYGNDALTRFLETNGTAYGTRIWRVSINLLSYFLSFFTA